MSKWNKDTFVQTTKSKCEPRISNIMVAYNNAALVSFLFSIFLLLCCFIGYLHPYKIMMYYTAGENGHNKKGYNDPFLWRLNIWASNKI